MQHLQRELEGMRQLLSILNGLRDNLKYEHSNYQQRVKGCHESGLSKEIMQGFDKRLEKDASVMEKLIRNIDRIDIPYIQRQIRAIEEEIQTTY